MDIREFAQKLGVSATTVSHALNGKRPVKAETRRLILEKMTEWGYTPNVNARRLVNSKTNLIAFFSETTDTLSDPYQLELLRTFCHKLRLRNYDLLLDLYHEETSDRFTSLRNRISSHAIDGSIIVGNRLTREDFAVLATPHSPCVFIDNMPHQPLSYVGFIWVDCVGAYREAMQCLKQLGRDDVVLLARHEGDCVLNEWRKLLQETGLKVREGNCLFSKESPEDARDIILPLLLRSPRPRAIITRTDAQAQGVLQAARQLSLNIPGEISLISHGDVLYSRGSEPALATVSFDYQKLATRAVELLFDMLDSPEQLQQPIIFPERFLPRGSLI